MEMSNESKMPEVIYAAAPFKSPSSGGVWSDNIEQIGDPVSYTRTDKVEELREALRECVKVIKTLEWQPHAISQCGGGNEADCPMCARKRSEGHITLEQMGGYDYRVCKLGKALTKASTLLQ